MYSIPQKSTLPTSLERAPSEIPILLGVVEREEAPRVALSIRTSRTVYAPNPLVHPRPALGRAIRLQSSTVLERPGVSRATAPQHGAETSQ